ncbi:helix-turn-helix transcriptional regulator [Methylophaga sp. OBS4]|uniref:helix-turn-helix transcriptional regulator n=1 Tax=Methylophaga sp. OBS4 TaxID=2991935 RepID=UPI002257CBBC|nr:helix-turn-helix transcriptional regulator [Methylophaga sp. OBS4]MCX4186410.1 helix-turn-helix transcriptional regulator [Methylophaga sp. OBS4]
MLKAKPVFIITIMLVVIIFNVIDMIEDFSSGQPLWHIVEEGLIICLALGLISYLIFNLKQQSGHLQQLQQDLATINQQMTESNSRIYQARKQYSQVIQQQFNEWHLSQSEQEIALLLLKGLSFNEIAALRQTREKTVRQQASEIYKKSGISGRHAFSAWFFEDFLN